MIPALARFVEALRAGGVAISPGEILDAGRALDLVGLDRRESVRAALRATLAKDRRRAEVFDRLFDSYFRTPGRPGRGAGEGRPGSPGPRPRAGAGEGERPRPGKPRESERRSPLRADRRDEERLARETARALASHRTAGELRNGRLRRIVRTRRAREEGRDPEHADLATRMDAAREAEIASEVPRMIQALRLQAGRRLARARTGRPWLRQALRENLSRGGVPFVIPFRARRPRTIRVVLVVDVSFSVARAAGLFLMMAAAFVTPGRRARVLAFVDRPVDATAAIARWTSSRREGEGSRPAASARPARRARPPGAGIVAHGVAFSDVLDGIPGLNLEAPSDYGRAFHALLAGSRRPRGRDTILVVLGDGRTNRFEPLAWAFDEVARGFRFVMWLVPEPAVRWGTADSALPAYLRSVDVAVEATDLAGLARGLSLLVRRL